MGVEVVRSAELPFWDLIEGAFRHQKIPANFDVQSYLSALLARFVRQDNAEILDKPLLFALRRCVSVSGNAPLKEVRKIGDAALFVSGIIAPNVRRSMGAKFYILVSEEAYGVLRISTDPRTNGFWEVDRRFSENLGPYSQALAEIGREYVFRGRLESALDVYERFVAAGGESGERARWFAENGVVFLPKSNKLIV